MVDVSTIPGTRAHYDRWMAEKHMREAAAQTKAANDAAVVQYEAENPAPPTLEFADEGPVTSNQLNSMYEAPLPAPPKDVRELPGLDAMDEMATAAAKAESARRSGGVPTVFDVGAAAGMGSQAAGADAYGLAQQAATDGVRSVTSTNPMAAPVRRYTAETRRTDAETRDAMDLAQEREYEYSLEYQKFLDKERRALDAGRQAQAEDEQIRATKAAAQLARSNQIQAEVDKAAAAFKQAPEEDQGRFWASRNGFQKFALVLSAAMKGWLKGGGMDIDPMATIRSAIQEDIETQRSNRAKLGEQLTARERQAAQARNTYEQLMEKFGDERLVSNMLETSRLKEAQARLALMEAGRDTALMDPQHQQLKADLDSEIAKKELERRALEIKTPPTVTRTAKSPNVRVVGPDGRVYVVPRSFAQQQATEGAKQGRALQMKAVDVTAEGAKQQIDASTKLQESVEKAKASMGKGSAEMKRFIAKETATPVRIRELASDLLADIERNGGDVPGVGSVHIPLYGAVSHEMTAAARDFKRKLDALGEYDITDLTGAVASDQQQKIIDSFKSGNEESILSGLTEIQRAMDSYIDTIEAADPESAMEMRQHSRPGDLGGWRGARVDAPRGAGVVNEDEDVGDSGGVRTDEVGVP